MKYQVGNCSIIIKFVFPLLMRVVHKSCNCSLLLLEAMEWLKDE